MEIKSGNDSLSLHKGYATLTTQVGRMSVSHVVELDLVKRAIEATKRDLPPKPLTSENKAEFDARIISNLRRFMEN